jgi:hypothetical protein
MKALCFPKFQCIRKIADRRLQSKENADQVITPCLYPNISQPEKCRLPT